METDAEQVLAWLAQQGQGLTLWDGDVMRAFEWSAERAQAALRCLEAASCIAAHPVKLPVQGVSLGYLRVTRRGRRFLDRRRSVVLERLRRPLTA